MTATRWQRVASIFDVVVELPADRQLDTLSSLCGDDESLRKEVLALLAADAQAGDFEDAFDASRRHAAADWADALDARIDVDTRIGPWRVTAELGRGGMGVVYRVERDDGQFTQTAALKLIKRGMESDAVLARFLRERQLLAQLAHPNIAALVDGGLSSDGRPYFVMEYVEGLPLPEYCAAHRLGLPARIALVIQICGAVQFAHRQLVVHRDLKPANVLVTADGRVKLLDFGIAKLLDREAGGNATHSIDARMRPLTPAYAAPEQIAGGPITTATDIYGLGCLLYEVLTGQRVHPEADAAQRRTTAAPSQAAAGDAVVPARLLRGDLDTIVLAALQPEPERRYPTAAAFADDLQRYLDGQPITARRDTLRYRAGKFVARHRLGVAASALAVAALVATTSFALWAAAQARDEARRAETVTGFLVDIFRVADPKDVPGGVKMSALDVLDAGARRFDAQLAREPQLALRIADVIGRIYTALGQYDRAIALLERAGGEHGEAVDDVARAALLARLARAQYEKGDYPAAQKSIEAVLATHRRLYGERSPQIADDIGLQGEILRRQGDFARAEPLIEQALATARATLPAPHAQIALHLTQLAALRQDQRRVPEGGEFTEQALAMSRRLYGEDHLDVAESLSNLGSFRAQTDRIAEAPALFEEALAIYRRLLPGDHPALASTLSNKARALDRLGRYDESERAFLEALAMQQRLIGETHPDIAATLNNLAILRTHQDDYGGSADYSRRAYGVWAALGKPTHPFALGSRANLAVALRERGDLAEAERLTREVLAAREAQTGEKNLLVSFTHDQLGIVLRMAGHANEAVAEHRRAQALRSDLPGVPPLENAAARVYYAQALLDAGDAKTARIEVDAALAALTAIRPQPNDQLGAANVARARIALAGGDIEAGCAAADAALRLRPPVEGAGGWRHAEAQDAHATCLAARGDPAGAATAHRDAVATLARTRGADHWMTRRAQASMAGPG